MPPTHHESVIVPHIFNTFPYGFSFIEVLTTSVSGNWVCASAGICFSYFCRSPSSDLPWAAPIDFQCTCTDLYGELVCWKYLRLKWKIKCVTNRPLPLPVSNRFMTCISNVRNAGCQQVVISGLYWFMLIYPVSPWYKLINLNSVRNKRKWCVLGAAGGAGIPDLWLMFSGVYFWKESLCFDLIGFDSTTNRAVVGDVRKCMLSESSLLPYSITGLGFGSEANGEPTSGWFWQTGQIQPEGSLVDMAKEVK